jgi:hypothetical protein
VTPKQLIKHGNRYPYDATDAWWHGDGTRPPPPADWAVSAARGVLASLQDRRSIKQGFVDVDEDVRRGIVEELAAVIRAAKEGA